MTKGEMLMAAKLLRMASEEFGNHGCNDFDAADLMPKKEAADFVRKYHEHNGDHEEWRAGRTKIPDFCAMSLCARLLEEEARK